MVESRHHSPSLGKPLPHAVHESRVIRTQPFPHGPVNALPGFPDHLIELGVVFLGGTVEARKNAVQRRTGIGHQTHVRVMGPAYHVRIDVDLDEFSRRA